jgi:hypothetical protein
VAANPLRQYDDEFLLCRRGNLGHVWAVVGYYRDADGLVRRLLECERCESERRDRWDRGSGDRLTGSYKYAEGYQITGNETPTSATDVRLEAMRRATVYANEDAMLAHLTTGKVTK